jgi:hypothetical protein
MVAALFTGLLGAQTVAWAINTGDIIVADRRTSGLVFIDHVTGAQHTLSAAPDGSGFIDVTTSTSGDVFAVAATAGVVYKIDTITGSRTVVASRSWAWRFQSCWSALLLSYWCLFPRIDPGVDPVSRTPYRLWRRVPRCRGASRRIRRSSGAGSSSCTIAAQLLASALLPRIPRCRFGRSMRIAGRAGPLRGAPLT